MIHIYFGKNGIGKTKKLGSLHEKSEIENKFLLATNKNYDTTEHVKWGANGIWQELEKFLNSLFLQSEKEEFEEILKSFTKDMEGKSINLGKNSMKAGTEIENGKIFEKNEEWKKDLRIFNLNKKIFKPKEYGSGNIQFQVIYCIAQIMQSHGSDEMSALLSIDEPEKHMHPELIKETAILLTTVSKFIDINIVTHSPLLINYLWGDNVVLHTKDEIKESEKFYEVKFDNQPLIKNLITHRGDIIESIFYKKIFIVEGNNDLKLIQQYLFEKKIHYANVVVAGGKSKIIALFHRLKSYSKRKKSDIMIIHDSDKFCETECECKNVCDKTQMNEWLPKEIITQIESHDAKISLCLKNKCEDTKELPWLCKHKKWNLKISEIVDPSNLIILEPNLETKFSELEIKKEDFTIKDCERIFISEDFKTIETKIKKFLEVDE